MPPLEPQPPPSPELLSLIESLIPAETLASFAETLLPASIEITKSSAACLYVPNSPSPKAFYASRGFPPDIASQVEQVCIRQFDRISASPALEPHSISITSSPTPTGLIAYALRSGNDCLALLGLAVQPGETQTSGELLLAIQSLLGSLLARLFQRLELESQLSHLNTYLTVSTALSQSLDLPELLEISLYCCMEAVPVEAASILLLDDEKKNFIFYEVQGASKPILQSAIFPADRGIAGAVLKNQQAEIINDITQDPRFYKRVDTETGFTTRNMIAIPLLAGEEQVGVMELLNKAGAGLFLEQELQLLLPLAEEISFAIRNAIVFEYVVNTYCKQRQGLNSCKGCQRPLGTWTPCVKYREHTIWSEGVSPTDTLMMPTKPF